MNCNQYPAGPARDNCLSAEANLLAGQLENNRYGTSTPLGGTQRLRSYDNGLFYAGQTLFYGVEYRWNLTDERTPFSIYLAKGIRTGIQLAAFWERGMVASCSLPTRGACSRWITQAENKSYPDTICTLASEDWTT